MVDTDCNSTRHVHYEYKTLCFVQHMEHMNFLSTYIVGLFTFLAFGAPPIRDLMGNIDKNSVYNGFFVQNTF